MIFHLICVDPPDRPNPRSIPADPNAGASRRERLLTLVPACAERTNQTSACVQGSPGRGRCGKNTVALLAPNLHSNRYRQGNDLTLAGRVSFRGIGLPIPHGRREPKTHPYLESLFSLAVAQLPIFPCPASLAPPALPSGCRALQGIRKKLHHIHSAVNN